MEYILNFEEWLDVQTMVEAISTAVGNANKVKVEKLYESKALLEYNQYKNIPGSRMSFRQDHANTNTGTQLHAHVFAGPDGTDGELFAINVDGTAHDRSHGAEIPRKAAKHFSSMGYTIPKDRVLESIDINVASVRGYKIYIILTD